MGGEAPALRKFAVDPWQCHILYACALETANVAPSVKPCSSFAVRDKITADSTEGLAVYSGSVFSVQFSKYRFLFLHYLQMNYWENTWILVFSLQIYMSV